jgi:cytochrome c
MPQHPWSALVLSLMACTPALANLPLIEAKQCLQCHAVDKNLIGPSFQRIAYRWRGNPTAEKMLIATIQSGSREGGGQHWSENTPMPNAWERPMVSDAEAKQIVEWIMKQ